MKYDITDFHPQIIIPREEDVENVRRFRDPEYHPGERVFTCVRCKALVNLDESVSYKGANLHCNRCFYSSRSGAARVYALEVIHAVGLLIYDQIMGDERYEEE